MRAGPPGIAEWLDGLPPEALPEARFVARPADVAVLLPAACGNGLRDDIAALAHGFAERAACREIEVRLEAVDNDACRLFHRDHVAIRLLTTYRGPGTEWIVPDEAERALGLQDKFDGAIERLPRFAVGMFSGKEHPRGGVVHRSPRVAGTGTVRLLLCLTPADDKHGPGCGC
ncbi:MAG: DUF1826 domain-containing protein [Parvibaculum sp.]|nr:DUF1826 domain-containing protein [Parvibaculum sp.]